MYIFSSSKFVARKHCAPKYRVHIVKYTLIFSVYLLMCRSRTHLKILLRQFFSPPVYKMFQTTPS